MTQRLVLFGATGSTGSHVLRLALDDGLTVRAYARSPEKIPHELREHGRFESVAGDFANSEAIQGAIEGANFVICTGGNAAASKQSHIMLALVRDIVAGMRQHGTKRFVYQAGAFSPSPGTNNPFLVRTFMRPLLGAMMGISGMLRDNDAVMAYLDSVKDIDWTVTRPGMLQDKPSKGQLQVSDKLSGTVHFIDMARFNLNTARSSDHIHEFPYLQY